MVVACVAILVVGPKDLPGMLRTFGKTVGSLRRMAGDFQRQFNDALKEAEREAGLEEVQKAASFKPLEDARKSAEAFQNSVKKSVEDLETDIAGDSAAAQADAVKSDPTPAEAAPATSPAPAETPAKSAASKKTPVKKTTVKPAQKAAASKPAPAAKTAAKKTAAKKTVAKKAEAKG